MPTVLDSFVLELRLDPTQFTGAQRTAFTELQRVETAATRSARTIEGAGTSTVAFFRVLEAPLAGLRRHFETLATSAARPQRELAGLATQGLRAGADVERGALAGAAGLRVLGATGLAAFAVVGGLYKLMQTGEAASKSVFSAGIGAAGAGVPIGAFSAISQALRLKGVPEDVTQNWLSTIGTAQGAAGRDPEASLRLSEIAARLSRAGTPISGNIYTENPLQMLMEIAKGLAAQPLKEAMGSGQILGLDATQTKALHDYGASLGNVAAEMERLTAITKEQDEAAKKHIEAMGNLANAWDNATRLLTGFGTAFDNWLANIINSMVSSEKRVNENIERKKTRTKPSWMPSWMWFGGDGSAPTGGGGAGRTSGSYSVEQMRTLAAKAGFTGDAQNIIAAIAMAESSGNPNAIAYNDGGKGYNSYGLTQINGSHPGASSALDPQEAFNQAYKISKGGTDFSPWSTYKSNAYRSYLSGSGANFTPPAGTPDWFTSAPPLLGAPSPLGPQSRLLGPSQVHVANNSGPSSYSITHYHNTHIDIGGIDLDVNESGSGGPANIGRTLGLAVAQANNAMS